MSMQDLQGGLLDVAVSLHLPSDQAARDPLPLCLFMSGAGAFVRDIRATQPAGASVVPDPESGDCWLVRGGGAQPQLRYRVDVKGMAARYGQPDYAEHIGATFVVNDQSSLLHVWPLPSGVPIDLELRLPTGTPLALPWQQVGPTQAVSDGGRAVESRMYQLDSAQLDGGSYLVFGPLLRDTGVLQLTAGDAKAPGTANGLSPTREPQAHLYLLDLPRRASDVALRGWIGAALGAVARFYGDLMPRDSVVTLIPTGQSEDSGIFGTVLRPSRPSAIIFFGGRSQAPGLHEDWLAVHELFHMGNPLLARRLPWLVEGFTTYYEEVLRARAGAVPREQTWEDLRSGFERNCQPRGGQSLSEDSEHLHETHRYGRVYWGGACMAFVLDVAIRARAAASAAKGGQTGDETPRSLDDAFRKLRRDSLRSPLTEADVLGTLDAAAGGGLATRILHDRRSVPVRDWLVRLGVVAPSGPGKDQVQLNDAAPLAHVRRAMF